MKRGMILVLVSCLAAAAGAGLQIEVANGKAMVTGKLDQDLYLILTAGEGATLSNFHLGAQAPAASYFAAPSEDFRAAGVPIPAGFDGEGWYLGTFPGEAYKQGAYMQADVALTTSQETRSWFERVPCPDNPDPRFDLTRHFTEVTNWENGSLTLVTFSDVTMQGTIAAELALHRKTSVKTTFIDGPCPEPATLSLLGLGFALIRRRSTIR